MRAAMFGFGLERLGLAALSRPRLALALVLIVTLLAATGLPRLGFNSDIRDIFRSASTAPTPLDDVTRVFGASDQNLYVTVSGDDLFMPDRLEALRNFTLDLSLAQGIGSTLSAFTARTAPQRNGRTTEVFPLTFDGTLDMGSLRSQALAHPLIRGKLISEDASLALVVVSLDGDNANLTNARAVLSEIDAVAAETLAPAGLAHKVTGLPAIRSTIIAILTSDQLLFKVAAFTISLVLSGLFFRSARYLIVAVLPSGVAVIWLLGIMGWAGQEISVVTNVVPSLVMVIAFSNAVHMLMAIRRERMNGDDRVLAIANAVRAVGPATAMTALTTAIALSSLVLVDRPSIVSFGLTAAGGTLLSCLVALTLIPALSRFVLGPINRETETRRAGSGLSGLITAISNGTARLVLARPGLLTIIGIATLCICALLFSLNQPQFRYGANLPIGSDVARAAQQLDDKLAGSAVLQVLVHLPGAEDPISAPTLALTADIHGVLAEEPLIREVWSLDEIARWYRGNGRSTADLLEEMRDRHAGLFAPLIRPDEGMMLVTGHIPDLEAATLIALADRLDVKLNQVREAYPGARLELTGVALHSARAATDMIRLLTRSLLIAIVLIILLIGASLRSLRYGALTILPNMLPITVAGAYLYLSGQQLQFTSIIIFTISFGIAVDSTIHVLNHYRSVRSDAVNWQTALDSTVRKLGPALILATMALMAGGVTVLSPLPMAQLYGQLIVLVLTAALIGDLLLLPALIAVSEKWRAGRSARVSGKT